VAATLLNLENFASDYLKNTRDIQIWLPSGYSEKAECRYPVLYVHDGQNLFNDSRAYSGQSWQLDRIVAELIQVGWIDPIILVAIDHAGTERLAEFAHHEGFFDGQVVRARGEEYENFIIEELKPHIDRTFCTATTAAKTALMGSSMGGLVSLNIGLRRSDAFGMIAALSPSCWWAPEALARDLLSHRQKLSQLQLWLDIGAGEGEFGKLVPDFAAHIKQLLGNNQSRFRFYYDPRGDHSEIAWRRRVHRPLEFLFGGEKVEF
jgi:predicted alpha/beta superfamily hydrolase